MFKSLAAHDTARTPPSLDIKSFTKTGAKVPANAVRVIRGRRLGGKWLERLGFVSGDVLMVAASPGIITYKLEQNALQRTLELVKFAREYKCRLVQVKKGGRDVSIEIPNSCIKRAGFVQDETLLAIYEPGLLKLQRPDLS